jgi:hypothetical protein
MMPLEIPESPIVAKQTIEKTARVNDERAVKALLSVPQFTQYSEAAKILLSDIWAPEPGRGMTERQQAHWPVSPRMIGVSEESQTLMRAAPAGTPLIGVVWFRALDGQRPVDPEIILHPTQSTLKYLERGVLESSTYNWNHRNAQKPETGSIKALQAARAAAHQARDARIDAYMARGRVLVNARVNGRLAPDFVTWEDNGNTSHTKLARLIAKGGISSALQLALREKEYLEGDGVFDLQKAGLTIGFALLLGGNYSRNKYTFTSRSSNTHSFSAAPKLGSASDSSSSSSSSPASTPGKVAASPALAALLARQVTPGGRVQRSVEIATPTIAWCTAIVNSIDSMFPTFGKGLLKSNWWLEV